MLYTSHEPPLQHGAFAVTKRPLLARTHAIAGTLAFAIILSFLSFSAVAECLGDEALITRVKTGIAWALLALVPAMMATGASSFAMVGRPAGGLLLIKFRRMQIVAANGILVLVPAALFLAWKAGQGEFDSIFVAVQIAEFAAGCLNLVLMGLNIRDGLRMSRRFRPAAMKA
jgi:hypothetical protein